MLCHRCGAFVTPGSRYCSGCGLQLTVRASRPSVGSYGTPGLVGLPDGGPDYSGFWRRAVASLMDSALLNGVIVSMCYFYALLTESIPLHREMGMLALVALMFGVLLRWLYFTLLESSALQATFGKRIVGIAVTDEQGERISLARANGRYWAKIISFCTGGIGYLMVVFTARKQALHDILAGTLVVRR